MSRRGKAAAKAAASGQPRRRGVLALACAAAALAFLLRSRSRALVVSDGECAPPLARHVRHAVDGAALLASVEDLARRAAQRDPRTVDHRNFGTTKKVEGGHRVTFLQQVALEDEAFLDELWRVTQAADAWNATGPTQPRRARRLRCLELLEYDAAANHSLAFHIDGETLLTVSVLLSAPGVDFDGGALELRRATHGGAGECLERHEQSARFDVLAWRGWELRAAAAPRRRAVARALLLSGARSRPARWQTASRR